MSGLNLVSTNLPEKELAFTNRVYASAADVHQLCGQGTGPFYVDIKGCYFTIEAHRQMETGSLAFNKVQREYAKIGIQQAVFVKGFVPPKGFDLGSCNIEVEYFLKPNNDTPKLELKEDNLEAAFREKFPKQVFASGQTIAIDFEAQLLKFTVLTCMPFDLGDGKAVTKVGAGTLCPQTELSFTQGTSGKIQVLSDKMQQRSIFRPDFNFEDLGIGGLSKEFGDIFRRAFAARVFPPSVVRDLGINQVRGMLLHGPPGTGKTLIARKLAKFLQAAEPKIVNGPEVLNKFVGQSEENIRLLFADAEKEQKQQGENSQLHIVIFDEIDAICKSRGKTGDSTGVGDSVVNQLLAKIDGVDSLNNLLIIGMTNRIDLIDPALLRPGRLEVHVEISLPTEDGRIEILNIHTCKMKEKGYLDPSVSINAVAAQTKNFSGAEIEGLVRSATSFALNRKVNIQDIGNQKDLKDIRVTNEDFEHALLEVKPAFGMHTSDFDQCIRHGLVPYSAEFQAVLESCKSLVEQVRCSQNTPLLTVLLSGTSGAGKTALSAHLATTSDYPFVRRIASENYVGYGELSKIAAIQKIFDDAYKSDLSIVVLDDIERLVDYVRIGPRFSNTILQGLFSLLKKQPPKAGRRLLVIGTTSDPGFLEECELMRAFNVNLSVPALSSPEHFRSVLSGLPGFQTAAVEEIARELSGKRVGIRTLLLVAEMAVQRQNPIEGKDVFMQCLHHAGGCD